jgi:hypothetical protein
LLSILPKCPAGGAPAAPHLFLLLKDGPGAKGALRGTGDAIIGFGPKPGNFFTVKYCEAFFPKPYVFILTSNPLSADFVTKSGIPNFVCA